MRGTIAAIRAVPGLFGLILFQTFNNFLGGVFMALMDAYGLLLVSVQVWGILWGFLSLGFIVGGLIVAKKRPGRQPAADAAPGQRRHVVGHRASSPCGPRSCC